MTATGMRLLPAPRGPLVVEGHAEIGLSLVVPTYNECANIAGFLPVLHAVLDFAVGEDYEVIVVDDDSPDRTWELAAGLLPRFPQLRLVRRQSERGLSSAVIRGWQAGRGTVLGTINADFQHPPEVLARMLASIPGTDLVVASRYCDGGGLGDWTMHRRGLSRGAQWLGQWLLPNVTYFSAWAGVGQAVWPVQVPETARGRRNRLPHRKAEVSDIGLLPEVFARASDPLSGCYLVRRSAIAGVLLRPAGYKTLIEILARGRIDRIAECGYEMRARREGASKVTWRQYAQYLGHILRLRRALRNGS